MRARKLELLLLDTADTEAVAEDIRAAQAGACAHLEDIENYLRDEAARWLSHPWDRDPGSVTARERAQDLTDSADRIAAIRTLTETEVY